jgi:hypothetical protein
LRFIDGAKAAICRILSTRYLSRVGRNNKDGRSIESMIRPNAPVRESKKRSILEMTMEDVQNDGGKQIARAIKAMIGVVYLTAGMRLDEGSWHS